MRIDLHAHSTASDGTETPAQLVHAARAAGLDVVAITDHDSVGGWEPAVQALPTGLTLVRGCEVSCTYADISMHLLAYLFDPADQPLCEVLAHAKDDRVPRAQAMVARLAGAGLPISWEGVLTQVEPGATVGRPHLADALIKGGVVASREEAFARYLHRDGPYYVSHFAADPVEAVRLVRAAGGVAVMAHPGANKRGRVVPDEGIAAMAQAGLSALEVDHPDHDATTRARLCALAADLGLLTTGASDYHGTGKPNRLGQETTNPAVYEALVAQGSGTALVAA